MNKNRMEQSGRAGVARGEAASDPVSDEACGPLHEHPGTGSAKPKAGTDGLLEAALTRQNLQAAWKRVKANKGAAGVDGLDIEQTARVIRQSWPETRQALLTGRYRASPVRKVMIPKPDGSQRELGLPTVLDRLIQQALLQVLQPLIDPSFSEHSQGFVYLTTILDVRSRRVLAHKVVSTLEACCAREIAQQALARHGTPEIVNTDQGSQFTAQEFTAVVLGSGAKLSMS